MMAVPPLLKETVFASGAAFCFFRAENAKLDGVKMFHIFLKAYGFG